MLLPELLRKILVVLGLMLLGLFVLLSAIVMVGLFGWLECRFLLVLLAWGCLWLLLCWCRLEPLLLVFLGLLFGFGCLRVASAGARLPLNL